MFGIRFTGHSDLRRILLPDDWVGHPLRKDWVDPEFYNGMHVKPDRSRWRSAPWPARRSASAPSTSRRPTRHVDECMSHPHSRRWRHGWRIEDLDTDEMILNMGPQHPSTHGVLRIELGPTARWCARRGRTSATCTAASRSTPRTSTTRASSPTPTAWTTWPSMGNSLGYALAVEKLMGIEVGPYVADHPRDHGRAAAHRLALHRGGHLRDGHRRLHALPAPAPRPREDPRPVRVDLRRAPPLQLQLGGRGQPRPAGRVPARGPPVPARVRGGHATPR